MTLAQEFARAVHRTDFYTLSRSPKPLHRALAGLQGRWGLADATVWPLGMWRPAKRYPRLRSRLMIVLPVYDADDSIVDLIATTVHLPEFWLHRTMEPRELGATPLEYLLLDQRITLEDRAPRPGSL